MLHLTDIHHDVDEAVAAAVTRYAGLCSEGCHDEAVDASGRARAHWQTLIRWLGSVGDAGYTAAIRDLDRLRTESGVAFAATDIAQRDAAEALPVVLAADDWAELDAGIRQRAALADAAVADIYTGRRAISAGLIPPGLVYGNPAFAAHCAGWDRPPRHWLHVYEANVARTVDGRWIILSDRMDAPLGDGWLLANRIATSQAIAEPFVEMGVRRLASHYAAFQNHLEQMMGSEGRLALLTGGDTDPRFFSHAYFARYVNATLVEPADLTVREGAAFVKTLGGLKRVDVLLRGVSDVLLDSLHRPGLAAYGAPALSLAARTGSLKLANAIGSAAFARRALAPYAHRLAQFLLGEDLLVNDAPCLWLGGARAREQVMAERGEWRIQSLTSVEDEATDFPPGSDDDIETRLARVGERYCAVQTPKLATTPVYVDGTLRPRPWMMRVFACRTVDGWSVAPGGVASVLGEDEQPGTLGFGKDVWVLPDTKSSGSPQVSGLLSQHFSTGHLRRTGRDLLSRMADEVFWLGRNAERAENVLRTLGVCLDRYLDGNRIDADPAVLTGLLQTHLTPSDKLTGVEQYRDAMQRLMRDRSDFASVPSLLSALRSGAIRARASISGESWRYIDRICSDRRWYSSGPVRQNAGLGRLIEDGMQSLAAFAGSAQENLTRNYGWRFLELGRRIERGIRVAALAEKLAGEAQDSEETFLRAWLTLSDSTSTYRSRYMMTAQPAAVIDLLVLDETNPRSLAFQIAVLEGVLAQMPTDVPYRRPEHRRALALLTELRLKDADQLVQIGSDGTRPALTTLAETAEADLSEISNMIARSFFAHADAPEAVVSQARRVDEA